MGIPLIGISGRLGRFVINVGVTMIIERTAGGLAGQILYYHLASTKRNDDLSPFVEKIREIMKFHQWTVVASGVSLITAILDEKGESKEVVEYSVKSSLAAIGRMYWDQGTTIPELIDECRALMNSEASVPG